MNKTILLVESEFNRQYRIKEIIADTLEYVSVYTAVTLGEAYKILVERTIDIFIVNVVLNCDDATDTAGMRFVARVREIPKYTLAPVIMISSLADPTMYAYEELNCLAYISKTFSTELMKKLLRKAACFETNRKVESTLFFRKSRVLYPTRVSDIVFMERHNGSTDVHLVDGTVMKIPYVSYSNIMADADNSNLIMCNRSTIVNKDQVYAVDSTNRYIMLRENRGMLDIGSTYRRAVIQEFSNQRGLYIRKPSKKKTEVKDGKK